MKKIAKLFAFVGIALLIIGSVIFVKSLSDNGWKTTNYIENTYEVNGNIDDIIIATNTSNITIKKSDDNINKVVCKSYEKVTFNVILDYSTLKIIMIDERSWTEKLFVFFNQEVIVYLVEEEFNSLKIIENTGDVDIESNFKFDAVDIKATTGDVDIENCEVDRLLVKLSTGDIEINNIKSSLINLEVTTGEIECKNIQVSDNFDIKVNTGDSTLENVQGKQFSSTGSTGDIYMNEVVMSEKIGISRDTGDVRFSKIDAGEIIIKTSTGIVSGSIKSDKTFYVETDTGREVYPKGTTGGNCYIKTDTGDIIITIEK